MKTLGKSVTTGFFNTPEGFENIQRIWKEHQPQDSYTHVVYQMLRGKDYRKSQPYPTNPNKVANGAIDGHPVTQTVNDLLGAWGGGFQQGVQLFKSELAPDVRDQLKKLVSRGEESYRDE